MNGIERANWTIAYRKPRANRFLRVATWSGTWSQAMGMRRLFATANPELEVYCTSSRAAEIEGFVIEEDCRNILVDSGRRVRIFETDVELPAEMVARIPAAEVARERWIDAEPIADAAGQGFEVALREGVVLAVRAADWHEAIVANAARALLTA
jgi:hypothetical protein